MFLLIILEQEMLRRERELEATIKRPAEAEKFRLEKLAEGSIFLIYFHMFKYTLTQLNLLL